MAENGDQTEATIKRRAFFKKMAALAFAVPVVSSFTLESSAFAYKDPFGKNSYGKDPYGKEHNQYGYNQTLCGPNQFGFNQYAYNQIIDCLPKPHGHNQAI